MSSSTRTPPHRRVSATGWPVRRTPRWVLLTLAGLLVIAAAVALVHKPSRAERATDLRGVLTEMTTDIQSCAAGVGESLTALRLVQAEDSSNSTNVSDGITIAGYGAQECAPANNELLDNLESYQVPESLASFRLTAAVTGLVNWAAPDAQQVDNDVASLLAAKSPQAASQARNALSRALGKLNAERAAVYKIVNNATKTLAVRAAPPKLPG
ncbi:MAG: hypothetical protein ACLQFR_20305 [Streptosporangiaceae bacterium]